MDDPPTDIVHAINAVAAAPTATSQAAAIRTYFLPHASFVYPVVYVPPSSPSTLFLSSRAAHPPQPRSRQRTSRDRIEIIYRFYRLVIPETRFVVEDVGWRDRGDGTGKLWVDLVQQPVIYLLTAWTGWRPSIEMKIHLTLARGDVSRDDGAVRERDDEGQNGKWMITKQEDHVNPYIYGMAFPGLRWVVALMYWVNMLSAVYFVWLAESLGWWALDEQQRVRKGVGEVDEDESGGEGERRSKQL